MPHAGTRCHRRKRAREQLDGPTRAPHRVHHKAALTAMVGAAGQHGMEGRGAGARVWERAAFQA